MSEKRFVCIDIGYGDDWYITDNGKRLSEMEIVDLLNEQQATISRLEEENKQLKERLEKINGGYGHLTHRNGLTANEWLIESQERELKKKDEQISDWIEQHSKDIVKIGEQQATIERLNRRLDYETRMHKKWKDDCLAILEEQDLNDYVKELQKSKKNGWDSEPNTDYVTRVKEGLK